MSVPLERSPRLSRNRPYFSFVLLVIMIILATIVAWYVLGMQSNVRVAPFEGRKNVIVFQGQVIEQPFVIEQEELLLPFDFVKDYLDPHIYWDEPTKSVIITTKDKVLRMESTKLVAFLNSKPIDLHVPVQEVEGIRYVPYAPLVKLYPYTAKHIAKHNIAIVEKTNYSVQQGKVTTPDPKETEPKQLRVAPSHKQPIAVDVAHGETVDILGEETDWYRVQTPDGIIGYLPEQSITLTQIRHATPSPLTARERHVAWKPLGQKINLVWEHVNTRTPKLTDIPPMPGLHVVSPTWFELVDAQATLGNKADTAYVKWAHDRGYQVWGLVSNGFNPDHTKALLGNYRMREKMILQILHYANMYDLDGINIDFENVYLEDKERLVQFIRELTPYLHEQNLTVSMDVTVKGGSERWSQFYDRKALGQIVDYIALMAYDEHWASSPTAGSVASLPWTERGIQGLLEDVAPSKLLLGVPFYTRLWKEEKQADGSIKVSSKALYMSGAQKWLKERNLTPKLDPETGQLFASYVDPTDKATYKMWLEDATSLQKRVALVHQYNLAGIAAWRRGFETPEIWANVQEVLHK